MADLIRQMEEDHETADIDGVIDEVAEATEGYESLKARFEALEARVAALEAEE